MIKHILLFMIVSFPLTGVCQEDAHIRRLISVGIVISPEFSYRTLNFSPANEWIANVRNNEEIGNYGFAASALAHFRLGNKLTLKTGLGYSNKSSKTEYAELTWPSSDQDYPSESQTVFHFKYLMVPVDFSYYFLATDNLGLFASAGFSAGIFLSKKTKVISVYPDGEKDTHSSTKQAGYSLFNLFANAGAGVDYRVSKRFIVTVEPYYQHSLTSIVVDNDAKEHLFSFGITTGVFYSF